MTPLTNIPKNIPDKNIFLSVGVTGGGDVLTVSSRSRNRGMSGMRYDFSEDTFGLPVSYCCECGSLLDACLGPCRPKSGDVTICCYCACLNVFGKDLVLRKPTDEEVFAMAADSDLQKARRAAEKAVAAVRMGRR